MNYSRISLIALLLIIIDRISKILALGLPEEGIFLFENKFYQIGFKLHQNSQMAFSIPINNFYIIIFSCLITAVLIYLLLKKLKTREKDIFLISVITIIIAGALGNLFDRIFYGFVIDFIFVSFYSTFNFADIMIVGTSGWWIMKELNFTFKKG